MDVKEEELKNMKLCEDEVEKVEWVPLKELREFSKKHSFGTQRQLS